jgi:hypothetical protein
MVQEIPGYTALFDSKAYQAAVAEICPGKPVLDPFQLGVIVQVPGQQVRHDGEALLTALR